MATIDKNAPGAASLTWSPLHKTVESHVKTGDRLLLIISPFIGLEALKNLFAKADPDTDTKVVVRWRPADLVAGVSDLEIFRYLTSRGTPL